MSVGQSVQLRELWVGSCVGTRVVSVFSSSAENVREMFRNESAWNRWNTGTRSCLKVR
jgi:hypothetical protein